MTVREAGEAAGERGGAAGRPVRVLLADAAPMQRSGLRMAVGAADGGLTVAGEAGDGVGAVELARRLSPDVVVMDAALPRLDGLAATRAIRAVASGGAVIAPVTLARLLTRFAEALPDPATTAASALDALTDREREVLTHVARGHSNAEIARALTVSETTIKTHVGHVLTKLGLRDRVQAVVLAYECGLVSPSDP